MSNDKPKIDPAVIKQIKTDKDILVKTNTIITK